MTYTAGFDEFNAVTSATETKRPSSLWFQRVGATLGAGMVGAGAGFVGTIAFGRLDTWIGAAVAGQLYLAALYLAFHAAIESFRRKAWGVLALASVHIAAMIGWPLALFVFKTEVPAYWLPIPATITGLALLATLAPVRNAHAVLRVVLIAGLMTALAANQATLFAMGS